MDNKKYEHLINLVINENREQASELFHEIVVEKSREIFESIMAEEFEDDMEEGMGGQVGDLLDEINAEEEGAEHEDSDEADIEFDDSAEEAGDDMTHDIEMGHDEEGEEAEHAEIEDSVIRIEDKLDQLMAEFEEIMGNEDDEMSDADDEMGAADDEMGAADDEEAMMEAITLKKVSVTHGDNGQNTKSTSLQNSGQAGMDSRPVKFSGASESVPTSPKGPSNFYSKGETQVKDASKWKNAPAQNNADLEKAPAPKKGDDGSNAKSPVAESRKPVKRRI